MKYIAAHRVIRLGNRFESKLIKRASIMDWVHGAFDFLGFIPGVGEIFDAANALMYAIEGKWLLASLSVISMIPEIGDAIGKGSKLALWLEKASPEMLEMAVKHGPKIKDAISGSKQIYLESKPVIDKFLSEVESGDKFPEFFENKEIKNKLSKLKEQLDKIEEIFNRSDDLASTIKKKYSEQQE